MGYKKVRGVKSKNGQDVYRKGNNNDYISRDLKGHNGGAWKRATSPRNLGQKRTRTGTFNRDLTSRIGD